MGFEETLKQGCYCLELQSDTKRGIIEEMVDLLVAGGKVDKRKRAAVLEAVLAREEKISTGLQAGVAVPHGKTDAIGGLVAAMALKKQGVDFEALDGEPSRIFVMTVSSPLRAGPHMEYLAEISRLLNSAAVRERVLAAESADELVEILTTAC